MTGLAWDWILEEPELARLMKELSIAYEVDCKGMNIDVMAAMNILPPSIIQI